MATTPHVSLWVIPGVCLCNSQLALKVFFFFFLLGEFDSQVWEWFNFPLTAANLQENSCRKQTNKLIIWCNIGLEHQTKPLGTAQLLGLANTGDWEKGQPSKHQSYVILWESSHDSLQLLIYLGGSETWKNSHTKADLKLKFMFKNFDVQEIKRHFVLFLNSSIRTEFESEMPSM